MTSSMSWNATPTFSPNSAQRLAERLVGVAEDDADLGRGRDERAGLVGEHLQVVRDRVLAVARADGLVQLAEAQALERVGLEAEGALAEPRDDLARAREQQVAGEDRDGVAPDRLGAGHAAAHLRLIHDVVVVERGEVGDLDAWAAAITSGLLPSPSWAVSRVSMGRTRLPPASSR